MKQCSKSHVKPLCHVGVFPNELKLAKVLPIYKSDDKRQLTTIGQSQCCHLFKKYLKKL